MSLSEDLQYVTELARAAGALVLENYGKVDRLLKRHSEAVTDADRASQKLIAAGLKRRFPNDGIVGEENDTGDAITFEVTNPKGRNWVIDPIDGTNNFIAGLSAFAVCIGLLEGGQPVLGVVYDVTRGEMYAAAKGHGAWLGTRRLGVQQGALNDGSIIMLTSSLAGPDGACPPYVPRWIAKTNWKIRMLGTAAIEAVHVASGVAYGAITINGKLWDIAASAAIAIEAGAVVTDLSGKPIFPFNLVGYKGAKVPYLMGGPAAHKELLVEVNR
jgi:myo-inositol-1(or 4)-monophosphatase